MPFSVLTIELLPVSLMPLCPNWSLKRLLILPIASPLICILLSYCLITIV